MNITTTKFRTHEMAHAAFERLAIFIETLPDRMLETFYVWQRRINDRRHMAQMDDRMLVDIGLDRADIKREIEKPFWRA